MISVTHAPVDERIEEDDEFSILTPGQRVDLDWQRVAEAFEAAAEQFGWSAHIRVCPQRRSVEVVVPADRTDHVARTTLDFYGAVADRIGMNEFLSVWVDFDVIG